MTPTSCVPHIRQPDAHLIFECNVFEIQMYQNLAIYMFISNWQKAQMSGHVKTSPGPQNTLRPQRVKDDCTCRDSCCLCPLFTNFEHFFVDVTHHCVRLRRHCFVWHVMISDVLPRWRLMGFCSHPLLTIIHRASVLQEAERDVTYSQNNTELDLGQGFQTFRSNGSQIWSSSTFPQTPPDLGYMFTLKN